MKLKTFQRSEIYNDIWPIDYKDENREDAIRLTLKSIIFYLAFLAIASTVIISMIPPLLSTFTNVVKGQFINIEFPSDRQDTIRFDDIRTVDDFWAYLSIVVIPSLFVSKWASAPNSTSDENQAILVENIVIGASRLRQLRVDAKKCKLRSIFAKSIKNCYTPYSFFNEDKDGEGYQPRDSLLLYFGSISIYPSGGYIELIKPKKDDAIVQLKELHKSDWLQQSTRVVFLDFTIFNVNLNLFCIAKLVFEMPPSGGVLPSSHFLTVKLMRYNEPHDFKILGLEFVYIGYIVYFIIKEVRNFDYYGKKYWTFFWTYVNLCIIIGSLILIPFNMYKFLFVPLKISNISQNEDKFADMEFIALWQWTINNIHAVLLFFIWIKIFRFFNINKALGQLGATLKRCASELYVFSLMFLILFSTYALMGYVLFGEQHDAFSTFPNSLMTLLITVLGDFDYYSIQREYRVIAPIFFCTYIFLVFFVLINMFVAIIIDTFGDVKNEIKTEKTELSIRQFLTRLPKKIVNVFNPQSTLFNRTDKKLSDKEGLGVIRQILANCNFSPEEIDKFIAKYDIKNKEDWDKSTILDLILKDIEKHKLTPDESLDEKKSPAKDFLSYQKRIDVLGLQFIALSEIMEKLIVRYNKLLNYNK